MASIVSVSNRKKRLTLGIAAVLTVAGAGAAYAYWTSTGTGDGTATTGEATAFVVTAEDAVGTLAPGSVGQTVEFTVTNPLSGEATQNLAAVAVTLAGTDGIEWVPEGDCAIDAYSAVITDAPLYGEIVAGGTLTGTATVALANTDANQDACQGQDVPLHFVAS